MFKAKISPSKLETSALRTEKATENRSLEGAVAWAPRPFTRWHLRRKYEVMEQLFRRLIPPHAKIVDMGCGTGEALVLAERCGPQCELWGMDMDPDSLAAAQKKLPSARLIEGDITKTGQLPTDYFDVVHEFGAAFMCNNWQALAHNYLSLLKPGGLLLWELPQKWSSAHLSYLLRVAPRRYPGESQLTRIARSLLPWKYRFESDSRIKDALDRAGYSYEVLERQPLWYFFARGWSSQVLDFGWKYFGDRLFDGLDRLNGAVLPRYSGYYLILRKVANHDVKPAPRDSSREMVDA